MSPERSPDNGAKHDANEQGFALVIVLFIIALLAMLAIGLSVAVRSQLRLTASTIRAAKAEAAADAGVQLAVLSLVGADTVRQNRRFPVNGQPFSCIMNIDTTLTVRVQDAGGLVSLNLAGERLLTALFIGLGASSQDARRAAALIIDYRDSDNDALPDGAEEAEYLAAGRLGPKNGPFDTVEELSRVLGLSAELRAAALPHLSVHSQTAGVDLRSVSFELTQVLKRGFDQLPARAGATFSAQNALPTEFLSGSPGRMFHVSSQANISDGTVFVRQAVFEIQSTLNAVPIFKSWSRGDRPSAPMISADVGPC